MARTRRIATVPLLLLVAACSQASVPPSPWSADAVRDLLESDPAARTALLGTGAGPVYCGVDVLGGSADGRYAYVWADCGTFVESDGVLGPGSGVSAPVRVDTTDRTVELPGDGSAYAAGVRRLFPPELVDQLFEQDVTVDRTQAELLDRAVADGGRG
jgi:hypothetical protein